MDTKHLQRSRETLADTTKQLEVLAHRTIVRKYYLELLNKKLARLQATLDAARELSNKAA